MKTYTNIFFLKRLLTLLRTKPLQLTLTAYTITFNKIFNYNKFNSG